MNNSDLMYHVGALDVMTYAGLDNTALRDAACFLGEERLLKAAKQYAKRQNTLNGGPYFTVHLEMLKSIGIK